MSPFSFALGFYPFIQKDLPHAFAHLDQAAQLADVLEIVPNRREQALAKHPREPSFCRPVPTSGRRPVRAEIHGVRHHQVASPHVDVERGKTVAERGLLRRQH